MFTEIQQYIKDKDYPINNDDSDCLVILADFKENLSEAYQEIFNDVNYVLEAGDSSNIRSDADMAHYTRAEMLLVSIIEDAADGHHETLTNLITHYTNDYIKTINAEIEDIEEE